MHHTWPAICQSAEGVDQALNIFLNFPYRSSSDVCYLPIDEGFRSLKSGFFSGTGAGTSTSACISVSVVATIRVVVIVSSAIVVVSRRLLLLGLAVCRLLLLLLAFRLLATLSLGSA